MQKAWREDMQKGRDMQRERDEMARLRKEESIFYG